MSTSAAMCMQAVLQKSLQTEAAHEILTVSQNTVIIHFSVVAIRYNICRYHKVCHDTISIQFDTGALDHYEMISHSQFNATQLKKMGTTIIISLYFLKFVGLFVTICCNLIILIAFLLAWCEQTVTSGDNVTFLLRAWGRFVSVVYCCWTVDCSVKISGFTATVPKAVTSHTHSKPPPLSASVCCSYRESQ